MRPWNAICPGFLQAILLCAVFAGLTSCTDTVSSHKVEYRLAITGSSTIAPLISEVAKRFETTHGDFRVDVQTGGSSRGIADVRNGISDIGMVARDLTAAEQDLESFLVARDGIAIIGQSH